MMPSKQPSGNAPGVRPYVSQTGAFVNGSDSPRAFLERCLEVIAAHEDAVGAFVTWNIAAARAAADASTARWKAGATLSSIDGMPVGIKDIVTSSASSSRRPRTPKCLDRAESRLRLPCCIRLYNISPFKGSVTEPAPEEHAPLAARFLAAFKSACRV